MSKAIIRVENLGKQYEIIPTRKRFDTLRDRISSVWTNLFQQGIQPYSIWALKDISFEVKRGEVIGVIGRNGAGKTTLLKILSRITEPTEGFAEIRGRIGSLLEVGTGFHPELTGKENIYLNGAILGMRKREIDRKFNEIVAFSEIEKFIDTPIKHYSNGMHVRLAFAVAAHLDSEILLVDEVLAVGDAAFQTKCLAKMENVAGEGRTVLFVSHNMGAVQQLCHRALWIKEGKLHQNGQPDLVIKNYLQECFDASSLKSKRTLLINRPAYYDQVRLLDAEGNESRAFLSSSPLTLEVRVRVTSGFVVAQCGIEISTITGIQVLNIDSKVLGHNPLRLTNGAIARWRIDELRLMPGKYTITLRIRDLETQKRIDFVENAVSFEVLSSDIYDSGELVTSRHGLTYMPISLEVCHFVTQKL